LREEDGLRVFGNRVLREILGPNRDVVTREWKRLHNEELCDLYCSRNIRMIRSRRMGWASHVAHMVLRKGTYRFLVGRPKENNHMDHVDVKRKIILK
jgi:hypothetical protein